MFAWQGGAAVVLSLIAVNVTGEPLTQIVLRWLPPLLFFTSAALCLTLITRRAIFSVAIISLLWFTLNLFGDAIVERREGRKLIDRGDDCVVDPGRPGKPGPAVNDAVANGVDR